MYLARRKAGLGQLGGMDLGMGSNKDKRATSKTSVKGKEIITCSECGTLVSANTTFCPHCGEYFEGEDVLCPGCGAKVSDQDTSCQKCGRIFEDGAEKSADKESKKNIVKDTGKSEDIKEITESEKLFCSECGAVVLKKDDHCPGCGLNFKEKSKLIKGKEHKSVGGDKVQRAVYKLTAEEELKFKRKPVRKSGENKSKTTTKSTEVYMCSICGADITETTNTCPKCGTELE